MAGRRVLLQAGDTGLGESVAPAGDGAARALQLRGDVLVLLALGGGQYDPGRCDQARLSAPSASPPLQDRPVRITKSNITTYVSL
jgi:hypothetical protein